MTSYPPLHAPHNPTSHQQVAHGPTTTGTGASSSSGSGSSHQQTTTLPPPPPPSINPSTPAAKPPATTNENGGGGAGLGTNAVEIEIPAMVPGFTPDLTLAIPDPQAIGSGGVLNAMPKLAGGVGISKVLPSQMQGQSPPQPSQPPKQKDVVVEGTTEGK